MFDPDSTQWRGPWLADRIDGDPDRLALLVPGNGYSPDRPLLHFARAVLMRHGWTTQELWWPHRPPQVAGEQPDWVNQRVAEVLGKESATQLLLVGKSLGTLAARTAADRAIPAIWLTPLLHREEVVSDLRRAKAPTLLVGGTADPSWLPELGVELGHHILELPDADHGLETDDDPVNSAEMLKQITVAMDRFVSELSSTPRS